MRGFCVLCPHDADPREALGWRYGLPVCGHCGPVDPRDVAETLADMGQVPEDGTLTVEVSR